MTSKSSLIDSSESSEVKSFSEGQSSDVSDSDESDQSFSSKTSSVKFSVNSEGILAQHNNESSSEDSDKSLEVFQDELEKQNKKLDDQI